MTIIQHAHIYGLPLLVAASVGAEIANTAEDMAAAKLDTLAPFL